MTPLTQLETDLKDCRKCRLHRQRTQTVFARGCASSPVMLVGEGPGRDEDIKGLPFVGRAGQLLDEMLREAAIEPDEVYITNIVKCRPPDNRLPSPDEVEACMPVLLAQVNLVKPRVIVGLGALASRTLISDRVRVTRHNGRWFKKDGIYYLSTYHPAAILRDLRKREPVAAHLSRLRDALNYYCKG